MALNISNKYVGQSGDVSPDYPFGSARNTSTQGDGTGTPLEEAWINDLFGFQQALLISAGIVPNETSDTAELSQYLQALFNQSGRVVADVAGLRNIEPSNEGDLAITIGHSIPGIGGGLYCYDPEGSGVADNNGTMIVTVGGACWKWCGNHELSSAVFGALETSSDNFEAIDAALQWGRDNAVTINDSAYRFEVDRPIKLYSGVRYIGGELVNTNETNPNRMLCVLPGNYHPAYFDGTGSTGTYVQYSTLEASAGDDFVILSDSSEFECFLKGDIVFIRSNEKYHNGDIQLPTVCGMNEVISSDTSGIIKLKHPLTDSYSAGSIAHADDNGAIGLLGDPLFVCSRSYIEFRKLESVNGNALERGGMLDSELNIGEVKGLTGVFTNSICSSKISVGTAVITRKLVDLAGGSNRSVISIQNASYRKSIESNNSPQITINENSTDNKITIDSVDGGDFDFKNNYIYLGAARRNTLIFGSVRVKRFGGLNTSLVGCINHSASPSDDQRYCIENEVYINSISVGSSQYGVRFNNAGGNCCDNKVTINHVFGSIDRAVSFEGDRNEVHGNFESGQISTNNSRDCVARGYVAGWMFNWSEFIHNDFKVNSDAVRDARSNYRERNTVLSISTTSNGNVVLETSSLKEGTLIADNHHSSKVLITIHGDIVGTNSSKHIRIRDDDGELFSMAFPAEMTGDFIVNSKIFVTGSSRYDAINTIQYDDTVEISRNSRIGLMDLKRIFGLDAWLSSSSDTINIRNAVIEIHP